MVEESEKGAGKKKPIVVIFDELEELFRSSRDSSHENRQDFFNQIANALPGYVISIQGIVILNTRIIDESKAIKAFLDFSRLGCYNFTGVSTYS
jgi:SpoVK/Ycf46/Vps4 family AAA+-type ATPase